MLANLCWRVSCVSRIMASVAPNPGPVLSAHIFYELIGNWPLLSTHMGEKKRIKSKKRSNNIGLSGYSNQSSEDLDRGMISEREVHLPLAKTISQAAVCTSRASVMMRLYIRKMPEQTIPSSVPSLRRANRGAP